MGVTLETLEIRFRADMGDIRQQLNALIGQLGTVGAAASAATSVLSRVSFMPVSSAAVGAALALGNMQRQTAKLSAAAKEGEQRQKKLAAALNKTAKSGKSASGVSAGGGIGLKPFDEVNLVPQKTAGGSSGGSSGSAGGGGGSTPVAKSADAVSVLIDLWGTLRSVVSKTLGGLVRSVKSVGNKFKTVLRAFVPTPIMDGLEQFAGKMVQKSQDTGKKLSDIFGAMGKNVMSKLADGVQSGEIVVSDKVKNVFASMENVAISETVRSAAIGAAFSSKFASGVLSGKSQVQSAAAAVVMSASFKGGVSAANSAGKSTGAGFASGIKAMVSNVKSAAQSLASAAISKLKSFLNIHSPSKVMRELGMYTGLGFAVGLEGEARQVQNGAARLAGLATDGLAGANMELAHGLSAADATFTARTEASYSERGDAITTAVEAAVRAAMDNLDISVPLLVDGLKLGEASIRGINAVTRSAGRLLLDI